MNAQQRSPSTDVLSALSEAVAAGQSVALATVVDVQGASPARPGFKLLLRADGSWLGNVGGGELEARIRQAAQQTLAEGRPGLFHFALQEEGPDAIGTLCGGEVTVFIDSYLPEPQLLLVGGGHIGRALAELARIVGYQVAIVDVLPDRADRPQLAPETISGRTYVVLISEDHVTDEQALRAVLPTPAPYVGMIGSRRKCRIILEHLRADGLSEADLARIHAPIGLDLGGREPAEIALAILAEIEVARHGGSGLSRSRSDATHATESRL